MVLAARLPQPQPTPQGKSAPRLSGKAWLALACGLALLLLLLLWRKATDEPFVGSWQQAAAPDGRTDPLLAPARPQVALSFGRDGSFVGHIDGEDVSGRWTLVRRDGQTNTLELTTPGQPPQLVQATPLDDGRLRVSFAPGSGGSATRGTYNLRPANSGCS
jgi:hypothetical protein